MNWTLARMAVYLAGLAASALALSGLATFDPATGAFDLAPFNVYAVAAAIGGALSSGLAAIALWRGWGGRK